MKLTAHQAKLLLDYLRFLQDEVPAGFEPINKIPSTQIQDLMEVLANLERTAHYSA